VAGRALLASVLVLPLAACAGGGEPASDEAAPPATERAAPTERDEPRRELVLGEPEVLAAGLEVPWGVAFLPGGDIVVTERPGRVRVVVDGELHDAPAGEVADVVDSGEGGLLGVAVPPDFEETRSIYLYYTAAGGNRVSRFEFGDELTLGDEQVLLDGLPAATFHNGGGLAFGPDGMLYVTVGDAGRPELAADPRSPAGAILRLTPDGRVPEDNPHGDSPVWSTGHRNAQGLAWDGEERLYASDHGPSGEFGLCCRDELNLVERGAFHGWPNRAGGERTGETVEAPGDAVDPVATSGPDTTWAPGGVAVDPASRSVLLTNLAGEQLLRFALADGDPARVAETETVLEGYGRLRAVVRGPDDCFYVTTSNRDGRGSPAAEDDRLLRLCPA